jgi:hypothetical protein
MMQATQHRITDYPLVPSPYSADILFMWNWNTLVEPLMRSSMIEIGDILANETIQMALPQDQHVIQTLSPHTTNEALTNRIRFGCSHRRSYDLDAPPLGYLCETLPILAVIVSDEKTWSFIVGCCFSYPLGNPEITGCV